MPRQANQELTDLIRSLNTAGRAMVEKALGSDAAHTLQYRLYQQLGKSRDETEPSLRRKLGNLSPAHFSGLKTQLVQTILDSITYSGRRSHTRTELEFLILQATFLRRKKLLQLAASFAKRASAIAARLEDYGALRRLAVLDRDIEEETSYKDYRQHAAANAARIARYAKLAFAQQQLSDCNYDLIFLLKTTPLRYTQEQFDEVRRLEKNLEQTDAPAECPRLVFLKTAAQLTCTYLLQEYDAGATTSNHLLRQLEEHPSLVKMEPAVFLEAASNIFYTDFALGQPEAVVQHLEALERAAGLFGKDDADKGRWELIVFNTRLKIAHKQADYGAVAEQISTYKSIIEKAAKVLPKADQLSLITSICISLFVLERWKDAEELLLDIKEANRTVAREDIFFFTALFHLLVLYERRDWYQLDNTIAATYQMLYSRKKLRPFEKIVMSFLKRLPSTYGRQERTVLINEFLEGLNTFREDPLQRLYFLYFDYYGWLVSKARGITYQQYRREAI